MCHVDLFLAFCLYLKVIVEGETQEKRAREKGIRHATKVLQVGVEPWMLQLQDIHVNHYATLAP